VVCTFLGFFAHAVKKGGVAGEIEQTHLAIAIGVVLRWRNFGARDSSESIDSPAKSAEAKRFSVLIDPALI
jgi:hypothetical protein